MYSAHLFQVTAVLYVCVLGLGTDAESWVCVFRLSQLSQQVSCEIVAVHSKSCEPHSTAYLLGVAGVDLR